MTSAQKGKAEVKKNIFADKLYINFADRKGVGVDKSKNYMDVIYGSPLTPLLFRQSPLTSFCMQNVSAGTRVLTSQMGNMSMAVNFSLISVSSLRWQTTSLGG